MKLLYTILLTVLFIAGCSSDSNKDAQEIKDVIKKNIEAGNNEDVAAYLATMDKDNKNYDRMDQMMSTIFKTYDLNYQVKDLKIIEQTDKEAKVEYVQITKKIKGPTFRDNKITGVHILHKTDGQWKIYDTQITKMEYLN
jgi:PBP1b-binding outer membrane lipoprotein LpoB